MPQAGQSFEINEDKMNAFLGKVVGDFGASLSSVLGRRVSPRSIEKAI